MFPIPSASVGLPWKHAFISLLYTICAEAGVCVARLGRYGICCADAVSLVPRFNFSSAPRQPCVAARSLVGGLVLLIPKFPRLKEWIFAGFTFDLVSAMYSFYSVGDPVSQWAPISLGPILLAITYYYHHKKFAMARAE